MLNLVLFVLMLLAMIIPIMIIGLLGLSLKGVGSIDLSTGDTYIVIATTAALTLLVIAEVTVMVFAAYLARDTQIERITYWIK